MRGKLEDFLMRKREISKVDQMKNKDYGGKCIGRNVSSITGYLIKRNKKETMI